MKTDKAIRLDLARLYGFKIVRQSQTNPARRIEQSAKIGNKIGGKVGVKN